MVKKIGDDGKKIGKVKQTEVAEQIKTAEAVSSVTKVKGAQAVSGAGQVGAVRRRKATRTMSIQEREKLFQIIDEEADKLFGSGGIPEAHREVVKGAVKTAIDAGLVENEHSLIDSAAGTKGGKKEP